MPDVSGEDLARLSAPVAGYPAWIICRVLDRHLSAYLDDGRTSTPAQRHLRATHERIRAAAAVWEAVQQDDAISAIGNSEAAETEMGASSLHDHELSTAEAADMLGVTPRRVVQLAADLDGVKRGGRWRFPRAAVLAFRESREGNAA